MGKKDDPIYYDKDGRQYYQPGSMPNIPRAKSPGSQPNSYATYDRRDDLSPRDRAHWPGNNARPADNNAAALNRRRGTIELNLEAKGYHVVKEETYDPHTGRLQNLSDGEYGNYNNKRREQIITRRNDVDVTERIDSHKYSKYDNLPAWTPSGSRTAEKEFQSKGYKFVKEEIYDPHTGKVKDVISNPDNSYRKYGRYHGEPVTASVGYNDYRSGALPNAGYQENSGRRDWQRHGWKPNRADGVVDDEWKPMKWMFVLISVVLFVFAILNLLYCVERHNYCRFWCCGVVLLFSVTGFAHGGEYRSATKNSLYILCGFLANIACLTGFAFLLEVQVDDWQYISENGGKVVSLSHMSSRANHTNILHKSGDSVTKLCFAVDFLSIGAMLLGMISLSAILYVADSTFKYYHQPTAPVFPFCIPALFNPYNQVQSGQACIIAGIITAYGCLSYNDNYCKGQELIGKAYNWQNIWSPVWAGILVMFGGIVSALTLQSKFSFWKTLWSIFLQFLAAAAAVTAVTLCIIGLTKNVHSISSFQSCPPSIFVVGVNDSQCQRCKNHAIVSAVLFAFAAAVLLVCLFYTITQLIRHVSSLTSERYRTLEKSVDNWDAHNARARTFESSLISSKLGLRYNSEQYRRNQNGGQYFQNGGPRY